MDDISFEVGQKYENRKGIYEVLFIDGDEMKIRWEDGEEIETTASLQNQIIIRMQIEKQRLENEKNSGIKKLPSAYGSCFEGMHEDDFSPTASGRTWRNRNCLGGAVTTRVSPTVFKINSWVKDRSSKIYWAKEDTRKNEDFWLQPKFFAQSDDNCLAFGLFVERSKKAKDSKEYWKNFISWLGQDQNESWLKEIASEQRLFIYDMNGGDSYKKSILSLEGDWILRNGSQDEKVDSLAGHLQQIERDKGVDLRIAKVLDKETAIALDTAIADSIARLFEHLMPVYDKLLSS